MWRHFISGLVNDKAELMYGAFAGYPRSNTDRVRHKE